MEVLSCCLSYCFTFLFSSSVSVSCSQKVYIIFRPREVREHKFLSAESHSCSLDTVLLLGICQNPRKIHTWQMEPTSSTVNRHTAVLDAVLFLCGSLCCYFEEVSAQKSKPGNGGKSDTSLKLMLRKMLRICKHFGNKGCELAVL